MKKLLGLLVVLCMLMSMVLGASSALAEDKVTIRFATQTLNAKGSVIADILAQFSADFPNVTIELEESPGNDLITKINTDIMGDNTPDVFTFWRPEAKWSVDKYIAKGALADLTDLVNTDPFFTGLFPDYAWRTATVDGKIYCIPRLNFYVEFLVNKKVFDQYSIPLPTDWASLVNACEQLQANGIIPWCVDTKEGLDDSSRLFNAIINRTVGNEVGLNLLRGNASFQQPDVIKALGYFAQVAPHYMPEDASVLDFSQVITKYMNTGAAGMLLANASQVDTNLTPEIMEDLVALAFPLTPETVLEKPSAEQDLTNLVYISAAAYNDSAKKEYVVELMKRLVSRDAAKRYVEEERAMVPHLGLEIDQSKVSDMQRSAAAVAQASPADKWLLSYAKPGPVDNFRILINEFWNGVYTPEEFAKALDDALYQQ